MLGCLSAGGMRDKVRFFAVLRSQRSATAVWSEVLARVKKTPAQQYLIIGLIPLVPGGTLYYAMSALVRQDWAQAQFYGYRVSAFVLGIAAGVSLTLSLLDMLLNARRRVQKRK